MLRRRSVGSIVVAGAVLALTVGALATGAAAQDAEQARYEIGCDLLDEKKTTKDSACLKTDVEAWYHSETSGTGLPPVTGLPEFNPYEENTLHVGVKQGNEDSRIYLTLDIAALPITASVTGGTLLLPVDADGSDIPDEFSLQSCSVQEPPEEGAQGSFEDPPKAACSVGEPARYVDEPVPHLKVDLAPIASGITLGEGIALVPGEKAVEEQETWHFSVFGRKNGSDDAVDVGAVLTYEEFADDFGDLAPPVDDVPSTGGGGLGGAGIGAAPGFSTGGFGQVPSVDTGVGDVPVSEPVEAAAPPQQPLGAVAIPRYKVVWFIPLALLGLIAALGIALTKDFKFARI